MSRCVLIMWFILICEHIQTSLTSRLILLILNIRNDRILLFLLAPRLIILIILGPRRFTMIVLGPSEFD